MSNALPSYARAVLAALRFSPSRLDLLAGLSAEEWEKALAFSDRTQLTLPLGLLNDARWPEAVRRRLDRNLAGNAERWRRTRSAYSELAGAYGAAEIEFVVLKGFSQCPLFVSHPRYRAQYDLDLFFPKERAIPARDIAARLGYEALEGLEGLPVDHLPVMIRKTGWEWRGDFFDIEIPVSLEVHFRLWNEQTEGFAPRGLEQFWLRRRRRDIDGLEFAALHPADAVAYAALHLLRHLLRGDLRPSHVYELAWFLEHSADDEAFWSEWRELHDPSLRRLEAICFGLAQRWFDCRAAAAAQEEARRLPAEVTRWLDTHWEAPLIGLFHPNKHELWLHWNLVDSPGARLSILRRRLLPMSLPGPVDAVNLREEQITWRVRWRRRWRYLAYVAARLVHHIRALPPTVWSAVRWFGGRTALGREYWGFFLTAGLYDFGLFIFFLLYNLYLLQLGFRESFLGWASSAMMAGSLAGSLPAAVALNRYGIRNTLLTGFAITACLCVLRAYVIYPQALLALAFVSGAVSSVWAVSISPAVAKLTNERNRSRGFSLVFSAGIGIGVLGGIAGGRLPGLLLRAHWADSSVSGYREALLVGAVMVVLAMWPLSRLKLGAGQVAAERRLYRPSPRITRFLIAMAVWGAGTGMFNPFFNAFFARRRVPVEQIGVLFSGAQLAQACAVLLAPLVFRRFGLIRGVSGMQFATALALVALAASQSPILAGCAYVGYMVSQYMSEPGTFTWLMETAPEKDRGNASAANFVVAFATQAIAAAVAGTSIDRFGYGPVLVAAALLCAVAAVLFRVLLGQRRQDAVG